MLERLRNRNQGYQPLILTMASRLVLTVGFGFRFGLCLTLASSLVLAAGLA